MHALAVILIAATIGAPAQPSAPRMSPRMVFVSPANMPSALIVTPRLTSPSPVREITRPETPKPLPVVPAVTKPVEPPPAPLVTAKPAALEPLLERQEVQRPIETGLFDRADAAGRSQTAATVTTGSFGGGAASPRGAAGGSDPVTTGGFSSGARAPRAARTSAEVQTAGFDSRISAADRSSAPALTKHVDRPVEIVFKPTPEYTDEARSARVEGTVSLELEFTAAGNVRVLRVVRGLGYGLDEAAQRAALRIRFKPAQSDAGPVDSTATIHITFRLS